MSERQPDSAEDGETETEAHAPNPRAQMAAARQAISRASPGMFESHSFKPRPASREGGASTVLPFERGKADRRDDKN